MISNHDSDTPVSTTNDYTEFAVNTISLLDDQLASDTNSVTSPLSYSMCLAGLAFASDNTDSLLATLGYEDISDLKMLIEMTNWNNSIRTDDGTETSMISSIVFHQLIDSYGNYSFDEECRQTLADNWISTLRSPLETYYEEACELIKEACEKELSVPQFADAQEGSEYVYSALSLSDSFMKDISVKTGTFYGETTQENIQGMSLSQERNRYYETDVYQAFTLNINYSDLTIFLPKDGYSTSDINLSSAYEEFSANATSQYVDGFIPFFSLSSDLDLTDKAQSAVSGTDVLSKLLPGYDYGVSGCRQIAEFEFNEYGVEGSAVTVIGSDGDIEPQEAVEFTVDHPFKAVSTYKGLPLFTMNVASVN